MLRTFLALLVLMTAGCTSAPEDAEQAALRDGEMTRTRLESLLRQIDENARGVPGLVEFSYGGVTMTCISDIEYGRMRIVTPIVSVEELSAEQVGRILEANFHTALDARYATSQGVLYAAFIHPLAPLTRDQLGSAVHQVATLARTFGSEYTSGALRYGGGEAL